MYNGEMIDELIDMVERAEDRAAHRLLALPEAAESFEVFAPRFIYDSPASQPVLIGVA